MIKNEKVLNRIKDVMWALLFAGVTAGIGRFVFGLGAATNMLDALPWGWWKVFNMVAGAALATSGFVVAAIIYIFQSERWRPVARLSVIVGFLGYSSSLAALMFDIGLPHRGWHPFFMWNPHSFLFEVFWCVSVYWAVTALELLPIITERLPFKRFTHWLHEKMLPFVVIGVTLSTMHHSSLGALFMASATRLHPVWHSFWIPPEFFLSAMGAGLSTIILCFIIVSRLYDIKLDRKVIDIMAVASGVLLACFAVLKGVDLTVHDKWNFIFGADVTWESKLFWVEFSLQALIPMAIFAVPVLRRSLPGLVVATSAAVIGILMHRLDTGIVGYFRTAEAVYIPNLSEFLVSFGILSAAGLAFFFLIERFHVLDDHGMHADGHHDHADPEADDYAVDRAMDQAPSDAWTMEELKALLTGRGAQRVTRILILCVPAAWIALADQATSAYEPIRQPIVGSVIATDALRSKLEMDANRNGMATLFGHKKHQTDFVKVYKIEEKATCEKCHHLSLPRDTNTSCRFCHGDMELDTPIFKLENHAERFETPEDREAFMQVDLNNRMETFKACMGCHKEDSKQPIKGLASYAKTGFSFQAPGFKHAMHGSCLTCHRLREQERKEDAALATSRGNCLFCHRDWADEGIFKEIDLAAAAEALSGVQP